MRINFISESEFFSKDHGVHTAYLTIADMMRDGDQEVKLNKLDGADITHIHTVGPLGLYKLLTSKHTVVSAHVIPASFIGSLKWAKYWSGLAKKYLRFFYNKAELVLAVAPYEKKELKELGIKSRVEIFPNPVNEKLFKKNAQLKIKGRKLLDLDLKDFVFIGVGQIQPRKGIADFIKLAEKFPKYKFVWIGSTPFKELTAKDKKLNSLLKNPPVNFFVKGPFFYKDMPAIYNSADVFLFPSYQENAPMSIIEAAACGLPIILRDIIEYETLYDKNYIKCSNFQEFENNIEKLINNKNFYKEQINKSNQLASNFKESVLKEKLISYYKSLLV